MATLYCTVLLSSVLMWMECGNTVLYCAVEFCIDVDGMWQLLSSVLMWMECGNTVLYCTVEFCIDVDGMWQHGTVC